MLRYILKRLLIMIPTMLAIIFIILLIVQFMPNTPGRIILGSKASEEQVIEKNSELGYYDPIPVKYCRYIKNALKGDFGTSYQSGRPVFEVLLPKFPTTLCLAFFSILIASVLGVLIGILNRAVPDTTILGLLLENMIGVALVEEFFKMQACKLSVWRNPEFNYTFDGIVYSVAAAIGFAAFENLMYVFDGGLATALARAITAIPGHTIFGIFMGMHLGIAKYQEVRGNRASASRHKRLALLVPMVLHGLYDFICSLNSEVGMVIFFVGLIILDIIAIRNVKAFGANDTPIY